MLKKHVDKQTGRQAAREIDGQMVGHLNGLLGELSPALHSKTMEKVINHSIKLNKLQPLCPGSLEPRCKSNGKTHPCGFIHGANMPSTVMFCVAWLVTSKDVITNYLIGSPFLTGQIFAYLCQVRRDNWAL